MPLWLGWNWRDGNFGGSGLQPPVEQLQGFSVSVCELKINGSPAYRCVYVTKYEDALIVLHSFIKTTNGVDRPAMQVVDQRLKTLQAELKKQKQAELKKQKR